MFVKANDVLKIGSISKWLEAFHIFVVIYWSRHSSEISDLMTYAPMVQGIAKSCGDDAALEYDEKFVNGVTLPLSPVLRTKKNWNYSTMLWL